MDLSRVYSLHVHSNQDYYSSSSAPMWKDKCLRPQRLSLDSTPMKNINISWDHVTHVVAHNFTIDQAMTVIRSAPLLTSFELMEADEESAREKSYSTDFVHENLQRITYQASSRSSDEITETIFSFNIFPALQTVDYHTLFRTDDDSLLDNLIQNKPPVQDLTLCASPYESWYVMLALRAVGSTLKRLDFEPFEEDHEDFEYDILFERLAEINSCPPSSDPSESGVDKQMFLPCLEYFKFTSGWPFAWDRVPAFFGSPSDPYRRPLKEFSFSAYNDHHNDDHIIPKKDLPALVDLRKAGFVVQSRGYRDILQKSLEVHGLCTPTSPPSI
ncbi:hypothetical protein D9613_009235 [Agrocybe pediades]|uniref:Uncharacterized protein n=1 Tax=Agrocybe pediades TaxID=84607 RepID=A0A8H4VWK7_9AGAR|nr:hypothetical protein D9613_009235 [Agrocybe pediades]